MIALQHVGPDEWEKVGSNFDALMQLVVDTGGKNGIGVRWGTTTFTFTAGTTSAGVNQAHGLGRVPVAVVMTGWWVNTGTRLGTAHVLEPSSWTSSIFPCIATVQGAAYTGSATASWVVIG